MATIDIEMLKRVSAELITRKLSRRGSPNTFEASHKNEREIQQLLQSYAERAGFPVDELNRLRAERQAERRRLFERQAAEIAQVTNEEEVAFRQAMESQHKALDLLLAPAGVTTLIQPIDIFLAHNAHPVDFDKHIEPGNSFAKVHIERNSGDDQPLVFYPFLWANASQQFAAVINVGTMLRFSGVCKVYAATGIFEGHRNSLAISATLQLTRGHGWGTDPNGNPLDGTLLPVSGNTLQNVAFLSAEGGGLFGDQGVAIQSFVAAPVGLGVDFVVIPAGASVMFNVVLSLYYHIEDGNISDDVIVDFATDQFRVGCPFFHVELLTS